MSAFHKCEASIPQCVCLLQWNTYWMCEANRWFRLDAIACHKRMISFITTDKVVERVDSQFKVIFFDVLKCDSTFSWEKKLLITMNVLKFLHMEGACKCTFIMCWVYSDNTDSLQPCGNGYTQLWSYLTPISKYKALCLDYLLTSCSTLGSVSSSSESPPELDSSSSKFPTE